MGRTLGAIGFSILGLRRAVIRERFVGDGQRSTVIPTVPTVDLRVARHRHSDACLDKLVSGFRLKIAVGAGMTRWVGAKVNRFEHCFIEWIHAIAIHVGRQALLTSVEPAASTKRR